MSPLLSIISAIVSGILNGSYAAPMKLTKKWEWENIWLLYSLPALIILPWLMALFTVTDLLEVYRNTDSTVIIETFLFGAGWGLGAVAFGLGLHMVGLSLGYTVMMGIIAVTGTLIPMLVREPGSLLTFKGMIINIALLITVGGVILCGLAGKARERSVQSAEKEKKSRTKFKWGLLVCLIAGVFSAMLNLAFDLGAPIAESARIVLGEKSSSFRENNAIWCLVLTGGFIPNFLYCSYLLIRKGTWRKYNQSGTGLYWVWGCIMGVIFIGSIMFYGLAASNLGKLGTTVGWLIFISSAILTGNLWGVVTGEWEGVSKEARNQMLKGSLLLIVSVLLVSIGNYFFN